LSGDEDEDEIEDEIERIRKARKPWDPSVHGYGQSWQIDYQEDEDRIEKLEKEIQDINDGRGENYGGNKRRKNRKTKRRGSKKTHKVRKNRRKTRRAKRKY
jgi:hypothetical protein